jgi:hypothetical protein
MDVSEYVPVAAFAAAAWAMAAYFADAGGLRS